MLKLFKYFIHYAIRIVFVKILTSWLYNGAGDGARTHNNLLGRQGGIAS